MNIPAQTLLLLTSLLVAANANAMGSSHDEKLVHGEKMHADHCMKCHTDEMYTRDNRVVKSLSALGTQVRMCRDNTGTPWFDEDTDAVVHFLNQKYYKF